MAIDRIKKGKLIPNYVQETKFGNREWKKGVTPEAIQMMTGKNIRKESIMSPAQAEKLGIKRNIVSQMTEKFFKGQKLVKKDSSTIGNNIFGSQKP